MSNVVPFPFGRRLPAKAIPREEFEQLAELALDVVQRIITLLDDDEKGTHRASTPSGEISEGVLLPSNVLDRPGSRLPQRRCGDRDAGIDEGP